METRQTETFSELLAALATAFSKENRAGASSAAAALSHARMDAYRRAPSASDPSSVLTAACSLPDALAIADLVLECRALLDWTSWEGEGLSKEVSASLFTTELVGPDGHIPAEDVRVGLLVSDVQTDYPVSSHSGEESYLVIAGVAEWTVGGGAYQPQTPGALIHHPAWVEHGRRTLGEPFLGAWRWSGDLDLSTFSVAEVR